MYLHQSTPTSFQVDDVTRLKVWLDNEHGFRSIRTRASTEYARMERYGGSTIILYRTGSVLVQGREIPETVRLLTTLMQSQPAQETLW